MKAKHQFLRVIFIRAALVACALLAPSVCAAQAQTPNAQPNSSSNNQTNQVRSQFFKYLTQIQPDRLAALRLRPVGYKPSVNAPVFSPIRMGAPLPPIVSSLNGMAGDLTLAAGANITITPGTNKLTIAAAGLLSSVAHNATLAGDGTAGAPLGISNAGVGANHLADRAVTAPKLNTLNTPAAGQALSFDGRSMIWQTQAVAHDETLTGAGTSGMPLGLATPLTLEGSGNLPVLKVTNAIAGGAVVVQGGSTTGGSGTAGTGVVSRGGDGWSPTSQGGIGVAAYGGNGIFGEPGFGIAGWGSPGIGLEARGGEGGNKGAAGAIITGGNVGVRGPGGDGVIAQGGDAKFPDGLQGFNYAGNGITAMPGQALDGAFRGKAGEFLGNVEISGDLNVTGGTKNFRIDHPLDPANKYLIHAAIESSEVLNGYSGNVVTNECGDAVVTLPEWFEAINTDVRYQLTVIGAFARAIVGEKVKGNRFIIKTDAPDVEVSWQVTGVRSDAAMRKKPFKVEENKPERERGRYLSPAAFDQPEEKGVEWARFTELTKQRKERREMTQKQPQQ